LRSSHSSAARPPSISAVPAARERCVIGILANRVVVRSV
jgi:hypothetical protein